MSEPRDREISEADERAVKRAKELFDASVEQLDGATLSRLNQGRHAALAELHGARHRAQWLRWVPATGVAAAAVVTVMIMNGPDGVVVPADSDTPVTVTDFEMLLDDENLEMLEELEFYSWLEFAELDANGNVG